MMVQYDGSVLFPPGHQSVVVCVCVCVYLLRRRSCGPRVSRIRRPGRLGWQAGPSRSAGSGRDAGTPGAFPGSASRRISLGYTDDDGLPW